MSRFISNDEILHRGKFAPKPVAIKVTVTPASVAPVEVKAESVIEPEVEEEADSGPWVHLSAKESTVLSGTTSVF